MDQTNQRRLRFHIEVWQKQVQGLDRLTTRTFVEWKSGNFGRSHHHLQIKMADGSQESRFPRIDEKSGTMDGRPVLAGVVVRFGTESGQEPELFDGRVIAGGC